MNAGFEPKDHLVAVLAFDGAVLGDIMVPCELFARAGYPVRVCAAAAQVETEFMRIDPPWRLASVAKADTVIVPGLSDIDRGASRVIIDTLQRAARRGARVASICTGAFVLAQTGLLDDARATTHWAAAPELARRHPSIDVDPDVLYVDNGRVLSSAGAAAAFDLCLHLIRQDRGATVAADVARAAVMPLERSGGQAQFIKQEPPDAEGRSLEALLEWLTANLSQELSLQTIARRAAMSTRTLSRRFREQTGTSPTQWVAQARVRQAQHLLETTTLAVDQVATAVGFGSTPTFRERFSQTVGVGPRAYRQSFRSASSGDGIHR